MAHSSLHRTLNASLTASRTVPDTARPDGESRRLGYPEAAEYLGVKVGTLRVKVHRGEVPFIRLGNRLVVFDTRDLDSHLASCRNLPAKPKAA